MIEIGPNLERTLMVMTLIFGFVVFDICWLGWLNKRKKQGTTIKGGNNETC